MKVQHVILSITMFSSSLKQSAAFLARQSFKPAAQRTISSTAAKHLAAAGQAEVILVGCGAPNRGMGWYHAVQMLDGK